MINNYKTPKIFIVLVFSSFSFFKYSKIKICQCEKNCTVYYLISTYSYIFYRSSKTS